MDLRREAGSPDKLGARLDVCRGSHHLPEGYEIAD